MAEKSIQNELAKLDATTAEELDALELNQIQDADDFGDDEDGTGLINDDLARDQIEGMTEVGDELEDKGVDSVTPGRDDTSETLRRHRSNASAADSDAVLEGNMDEPRDEVITDRKVGEGA